MNTEEDVLVLFADLARLRGRSRGLQRLAAAGAARRRRELREALDDSGIRWRVLVVSACYAGVFLDELKSDTTAIVTAADAEHSSFGCEDDRDLTWFGEAFLKDSLPGSASLTAAYQKAAGLIAQRETAAHEIHSNPQLYVGPLMAKKLAEVESVRARAGLVYRAALSTIRPHA